MNILDKTISFFSPQTALKRETSRMKISAVQNMKRTYEGASKGRRTDGWHTVVGDPNKEKVTSLPLLRERSNDLRKNNPYANKSIQSIGNNSVGPGIIPAIANATLKTLWQNWADDTNADFDERSTFYGLQELIVKTVATDGECLVKKIWQKHPNDYKKIAPLELQVLSGRFLDHNKNEENIPGTIGGYIIGGVEFNAKGKKIAYWIFSDEPSRCISSDRVPVANVLHIFDVEEPGQARGIPFATPSIITMRDFDEYSDAQLVRQKIAACFAAFISDSNSFGSTIPGGDNDDMIDRLEPGLIQELPTGKSITFSTPPPAEGFSDYSKRVLQGVAAGYGISYEEMTGDLSNVNFSSGRMGWIAYQRNIEHWQKHVIIPQFCNKVWQWFADAIQIMGWYNVKDFTPNWTPPRRMMIDPVKETNGLLAQVRAGFVSWQDVVRQLGQEPDEVLAEMIQSKIQFDNAGLQPESDPRFDAQKIKQILEDADDKEEMTDENNK